MTAKNLIRADQGWPRCSLHRPDPGAALTDRTNLYRPDQGAVFTDRTKAQSKTGLQEKVSCERAFTVVCRDVYRNKFCVLVANAQLNRIEKPVSCKSQNRVTNVLRKRLKDSTIDKGETGPSSTQDLKMQVNSTSCKIARRVQKQVLLSSKY